MIYFVQAGDGGPIKIGHGKNWRRRVATLQTGNHQRLHVLGVQEGDRARELELHCRFAKHRLWYRSEWFAAVLELLTEARRVPPPAKGRQFKIAAARRTDAGLSKALASRGVGGIADRLGIKPASVSGWKRIPAVRVIAVEKITGVSRHELRPDVYGAAA